MTLAGCKPEEKEQLAPEIKITSGSEIAIPAEGGTVTVEYEITNPVEGATAVVSVPEDIDWISPVSANDGTAILEAAANETETARTSGITVTYTWDGGEIQARTNAIQAAPEHRYDYEFELNVFSGTYYGDLYSSNGAYNFYTCVSDMELLEGNPQPGGTYYLFDLYSDAPPENSDSPALPAGTYTLDETGSRTAMTFDGGLTQGTQLNPDGSTVFQVKFTEGTAEVSYEGDNLIIDAVLTDTEGRTHHITYKGNAEYVNAVGGNDNNTIYRNIDIHAVSASASYYSGDEQQMCLVITLTDMTANSEGSLLAPGTVLTLETYMYRDENGFITPGEYTVTEEGGLGEPFKIFRGENMYDILLIGSYAYDYDNNANSYLGLITDGVMTVEGGEGTYTFNCNFKTAEGYTITAEWSGQLSVSGMPEA